MKSNSENEDEEDSNNSQIPQNEIHKKLQQQKDNSLLKAFTNFNFCEFELLYSIVEPDFNNYYLLGRGRKPKIGPKDTFLLLLYHFKIYENITTSAKRFKIAKTSFLFLQF